MGFLKLIIQKVKYPEHKPFLYKHNNAKAAYKKTRHDCNINDGRGGGGGDDIIMQMKRMERNFDLIGSYSMLH